MRWRTRVLRGRLREQGPVVAMVTAVAVAATTLVGLLAGLLHLAETQGPPAALSRLDAAETRIETSLSVNREDVTEVLARARAGIAEVAGDVPTSDTVWRVGALRALPKGDGSPNPHLTYLSSFPVSEGTARLVTGRWPDRATDEQGTVEVNVPAVAARERGWEVGARIETRAMNEDEYTTWVVVGTHESAGPRTGWSHDRLRGKGVDFAFNMPGSAGMRTTVAWGPLVVDPSVLAGPGTVDSAYLTTELHVAEASPAALAALREELRDASATVSESLSPVSDGRVRTDADDVLDATWREVVVTRAGVITIGLLLATLSTTVMLLAARLLAERRAAENELLAARGASPADLRSVVVLEAVVLAVLTWLAAPWISRTALEVLTGSGDLAQAGYVVGPGVPLAVILACGVMSGVLAVALCVPAWHTSGSSTVSAHAGLARAGADVALLVLGTLAMGQLVAYGSPLAGGPDGLSVDLVLVTGPALATLAAATLALRLVGPLGRLGDVAARRARSFAGPMAAWQVARRPSIATGTILVVVVAVAAGAFSSAFLATWRTSQLEQVDLALGTDVRVDGMQDTPLIAAAAVVAAAGPDGHAQPVLDRSVAIGPRGNVGGTSVRLVGVDTSRPQDLRGRIGMTPEELLAGLPAGTATRATDGAVPDGTEKLVVAGLLETTPPTVGDSLVQLVLEHPSGLIVALPPRTVQLGEAFSVEFTLPDGGEGLRIAGIGATVDPTTLVPSDPDKPHGALPVRLTIEGVDAVARTTSLAGPTDADLTPLTMSTEGWHGSVRQSTSRAGAITEGRITPDGDSTIRITTAMTVDDYGISPAMLLVRTWEPPEVVPAVISRSLLRDLDVAPGRVMSLSVGGTTVDIRVERIVDLVPGSPRGHSVLVDQLTMTRAVLDAGGSAMEPDTWWVAASDTAAPTFAASLATTDADVRTRVGEREESLSGPVRVAVPATMSLVTGAAALLVLVGVGAVAAAAVRARRLELARLQAVGASRHGLMGGMVIESSLLVALGAVVGLVAGYGLAAVVAPLLTMSPDGRTPAPFPELVWGWATQLARGGLVVVAALAIVAVVVALGVQRTSGAALRMGDDR